MAEVIGNGKKIAIYLRPEQLQYLDAESDRMGVSRSVYIERRCFPPEMWKLKTRKGAPKKN